MSFDWSQYLDVSQELTKQAKTSPMPLQEAQLRSAISRAYYAAFGRARRHLINYERIPEPRGNMLFNDLGERINIHQYVRECFKNRDDETYQEIGENLERLSKLRNIADYNLNSPEINRNLSITIQISLNWAKDIINTLRKLQKKVKSRQFRIVELWPCHTKRNHYSTKESGSESHEISQKTTGRGDYEPAI